MEIKLHLGKENRIYIDGQILPASMIYLDNEEEGHEELVLRIPMSRVAIVEVEH